VTDTSHFPVLSEIPEGEVPSLEGANPGTTVLREEIAESESDPGASIGVVHIILTRSKAKSADVVARVVFNFDSGDMVAAVGALPFDQGEDFDGGTLAITGGTGEYARWRGVVTVERLGPHRWSVDGGP
jgi:ABC-type nitrate/sulfonate/bicarbonate transport system substrate-binding protein